MSTTKKANEAESPKIKTGITHQEPAKHLTTDYDKIEKEVKKTPARNYEEELKSTVKTTDTSVKKLIKKSDESQDDATGKKSADSTSKKKS